MTAAETFGIFVLLFSGIAFVFAAVSFPILLARIARYHDTLKQNDKAADCFRSMLAELRGDAKRIGERRDAQALLAAWRNRRSR